MTVCAVDFKLDMFGQYRPIIASIKAHLSIPPPLSTAEPISHCHRSPVLFPCLAACHIVQIITVPVQMLAPRSFWPRACTCRLNLDFAREERISLKALRYLGGKLSSSDHGDNAGLCSIGKCRWQAVNLPQCQIITWVPWPSALDMHHFIYNGAFRVLDIAQASSVLMRIVGLQRSIWFSLRGLRGILRSEFLPAKCLWNEAGSCSLQMQKCNFKKAM